MYANEPMVGPHRDHFEIVEISKAASACKRGQTHKLKLTDIYRLADIQRQIDSEINRQTDKQAGRQVDRKK